MLEHDNSFSRGDFALCIWSAINSGLCKFYENNKDKLLAPLDDYCDDVIAYMKEIHKFRDTTVTRTYSVYPYSIEEPLRGFHILTNNYKYKQNKPVTHPALLSKDLISMLEERIQLSFEEKTTKSSKKDVKKPILQFTDTPDTLVSS